MTQTSREKRIYVQRVVNDTVASAAWAARAIVGTPTALPVIEEQTDAAAQTQIMLSGLEPNCQYQLIPLITGASGQIYEPEQPYIIRCDF